MDPIDYHGRQPTRHSEDTLHTLHSANIATQISCIVLITPLVFSKFLVRRWLRQRFDVSDGMCAYIFGRYAESELIWAVSCFLAWVFHLYNEPGLCLMRLIGLLDGILCVRSYMYAKQPSFIYAPAYRIGTDAYVSDGRDLSTLPSNDSQAILKVGILERGLSTGAVLC